MATSLPNDHVSKPCTQTGERARARRRVEALRLGVVPDVHDGTCGTAHPRLLKSAARTLELTGKGGGGLQAFVGEYGAGKTHLLESVRSLALQRGFVTARVVLDPVECKPSNPKRVFRRIATSMTYPDDRSRRGLEPLLARSLRSSRARAQFMVDASIEPRHALESGAHLYITPALRYLSELGNGGAGEAQDCASDLLIRWLSGDPTISNRQIEREVRRWAGSKGKLFSLKDYRPWARIYGYLLSGIARLARLAGYGGLAVFVDEAEFHTLLNARNRDFALEFFQALAWAAKSGSGLSFDASRLDGGGMGVLKELPACYDSRSNLYVGFAFTPAGECRETLEQVVPKGWCRELKPLTPDNFPALAADVVSDYLRAEPDTRLSDTMRTQVLELVGELAAAGYLRSPRDACRFVIALMDRAKHGRISEQIRSLNERYCNQSWGW